MEPSEAILRARDVLFMGGVVLACGSVVGFIAQKLRIPDIVLLLLAGIVVGPQVCNVIDVGAGTALNQVILIFGASYILFDGGASLHLRLLKDVWISVALLATVGVLVTALAVAPVAAYVFGLPFLVALLMGATIAPTDPATLMPVFKQVRIKGRVAQTVISESALNDATGAVITVTVLAVVLGREHFSLFGTLGDFAEQVVFGGLAGGVLGYMAVFTVAHERFSFLREYMPLVTLMVVVGAYLSAEDVNASGFMAAFVAGIVVGNKDIFGFKIEPREQESLDDYVTTTSLIMRMFIFILLGSQVNFGLLRHNIFGATIVVMFFVFVARPLTVFLCTLPDRRARWTIRELLFMSWVRETGVIPSALAGLLLGIGAPDAHLVASVVFVAVLLTILVQATTTRWWGAKLGLEDL